MGREGSGIRPVSRTSIEISFQYQGKRCRERLRMPPTPPNLKWAQNLRGKIVVEIEKGIFNYLEYFPNSRSALLFTDTPGDVLTLKKYLGEWLQRHKQYTKASTWDDYRKIVNNRLIPEFGHLKVSELSRKNVKDWLATLTCGDKTKGNLVSPLRVALDDAVEDELIKANPLAGWKLRRNKTRSSKPPIDPFSFGEQQQILNALEGQVRNLIEFAFWTGLRTSELIALDWGDIDFVNNRVRVERALTQDADDAEGTKTDAGERFVKLLPPALAALKAQKSFTFLTGEEVFQDPRYKERWTGDQAIREKFWRRALKKAGVRYRKPYQTRHTYASTMLTAGEPVMWVAGQMGHTDWSFTARTYARWIPDNAPDAGEKVMAMFENDSKMSASNSN